MSGYELYTQIKKIDEIVKVCFLTAAASFQMKAVVIDRMKTRRNNQQKNKDSNKEEDNIMNPYKTILLVLKNIVM